MVTGRGPPLPDDPPSIWTSGSFGSSSGCCSTSWGFGFDSLGSLPSFSALAILAAFHFAYLIFCCVSWSGLPQMLTRWKKVAAASKVVAVCLLSCQNNAFRTEGVALTG